MITGKSNKPRRICWPEKEINPGRPEISGPPGSFAAYCLDRSAAVFHAEHGLVVELRRVTDEGSYGTVHAAEDAFRALVL